jgi:bud emergence protein 1
MSPPKNIATTPPKKIIRALYDYIAQGPGELRFRKGDFLYVTGYENSTEWYEAYDPPSNMLGMVPVSYFEVVSRKDSIPTIPLHTAAAAAAAHGGTVPSQHSSMVSSPETLVNHSTNTTHNTMSSTNSQSISPVSTTSHSNVFKGASMNSHAQLYAVVKHEFNPERADELQASVGESIIIIARSNEEWVVAKPIGRLGGPGLIPINFIEIRDIGTNKPVSDLNDALNRAHVPYVEEWKRLAAEYKASSIPLGKIDDSATANNTGRNTPSISQQLKSMHLSSGSSSNVQQKPVNTGVRHPLVSTPSEKSSNINDYYNNSNSNISASSTMTTNEPETYPHVIAASVDSYAFNNDRYWYLVIAKLSNGRHRNLCRFYQDFYDFQINLLDEFPVEAGRTGQKRTLPFMPGPLTYVNDSISSQRRVNLDEYVKKLVALPDYISKESTVQDFFKLREGDIETDGPTSELPSPTQSQENMAISGPPEQVQEQQLQNQQPQQLEEQVQQHISTDMAAAPVQHSADLGQDPTNNQQPQPEAEPVTAELSEASSVNSAPKSTSAPLAEPAAEARPPVTERAVKIKIFYEDDLIAVRVLNTISLAELSAKITERLQLSSVVLLHKDDSSGTFTELNSDADLQRALGNKVKLVLNAK